MVRLRDLDLRRALADPARKSQFVNPMFGLIAPRYDDFTRRFSFGMDAGWKRALLAAALRAAPAPRQVVDLGCGTGDLGLAAAALVPGAHVTGVDASREMLALATARAQNSGCAARFAAVRGDLGAVAVPDASADLVLAGYAFRNGPGLAPALAEAARITRANGVLATLDFYRPEHALWRRAFIAYLRFAGRGVGWWWHREPLAYGYIAASVEAYVSATEFARAATTAGFDLVAADRRLAGGIAMHVFLRRP